MMMAAKGVDGWLQTAAMRGRTGPTTNGRGGGSEASGEATGRAKEENILTADAAAPTTVPTRRVGVRASAVGACQLKSGDRQCQHHRGAAVPFFFDAAAQRRQTPEFLDS
jgi:hypothetical protein